MSRLSQNPGSVVMLALRIAIFTTKLKELLIGEIDYRKLTAMSRAIGR